MKNKTDTRLTVAAKILKSSKILSFGVLIMALIVTFYFASIQRYDAIHSLSLPTIAVYYLSIGIISYLRSQVSKINTIITYSLLVLVATPLLWMAYDSEGMFYTNLILKCRIKGVVIFDSKNAVTILHSRSYGIYEQGI